MKYILTYVGLSDSDYRANGYSEAFLFDTLDEAKSYMKTLADNEKANCDDEEREYEILEDSEREFRMSWSCHSEQVRMQIHTVDEKGKREEKNLPTWNPATGLLSDGSWCSLDTDEEMWEYQSDANDDETYISGNYSTDDVCPDVVIDYDGCYELPDGVKAALITVGYTLDL